MLALCEGSLTTTFALHAAFVGEKTTMLNALSKMSVTSNRGVGDGAQRFHRYVRYLWTPGASLTGDGRRQRSHSCVSHVESILSDVAGLVDL